jgi:hypothetical protein
MKSVRAARRGGSDAAAAPRPALRLATRQPTRAWAPLLLLAAVLLAAPPAAAQPRPQTAPAQVSTPDELLAALSNGTASQIHLMRPMVLPDGWGPARVARPLLVMSPYRVILDWCDAKCRVSGSWRRGAAPLSGAALAAHAAFS